MEQQIEIERHFLEKYALADSDSCFGWIGCSNAEFDGCDFDGADNIFHLSCNVIFRKCGIVSETPFKCSEYLKFDECFVNGIGQFINCADSLFQRCRFNGMMSFKKAEDIIFYDCDFCGMDCSFCLAKHVILNNCVFDSSSDLFSCASDIIAYGCRFVNMHNGFEHCVNLHLNGCEIISDENLFNLAESVSIVNSTIECANAFIDDVMVINSNIKTIKE